MNNFYISSGLKRVNKTMARRMFNDGRNIILLPCKANPLCSFWYPYYEMHKDMFLNEPDVDFDKMVNNYEYYNCSLNETGKYASFYVRVE